MLFQKCWLALFACLGLLLGLAVGPGEAEAQLKAYQIRIKTADVGGAGTNANVKIVLKGTMGDSHEIGLDKGGYNDFESNDDDTYSVVINKNIGELYGCTLSHDDSGSGSGWKVAFVHITDVQANKTLRFPVNKWLSHDGDGYAGNSAESLKITLGQRPRLIKKVTPPRGEWVHIPTGRLQGVFVYNSSGNIQTTLSDQKTATLSETTTRGTTKSAEVTARYQAGFDIKMVSNEMELTATAAIEMSEEISQASEVASVRTSELLENKVIELGDNQVAIVELETFVFQRPTPGEISLGDRKIMFAESTTYGRPKVTKYTKGSPEFRQHLLRLYYEAPLLVGKDAMKDYYGDIRDPGKSTPPGNKAVTVKLTNATTGPLAAFYVDGGGTEYPYGVIAEDAVVTVNTYHGHLWRYKQNGRVVGFYHATGEAEQKLKIINN